ncbi:MAG: glucoamylase family protein [Phycisphaerales bacterium]
MRCILLVSAACALQFATSACGQAGQKATLESRSVGIVRDPDATLPPYTFSSADEELLDLVQRGAFNYLWNEIDPETGMVLDRTGAGFISVAGVGFQLGAICVADSRGWISRKEAEGRVSLIVRSLHGNTDNRPGGVFYHFLEPGSAGPSGGAYEQVASTIDTAILFSGLLTASAYFGGEVAELADELVAEANWNLFVDDAHQNAHELGFISLGWEKPKDADASFEDGLLPYTWADAGDEQRLTCFIAMCSPKPDHRVSAETYYKLRRTLGDVPEEGEVVWFPWSGALFTSFFAHCWIDYASMGADNPSQFEVENRPRVDWWENTRRHVQLHRQRALAADRPFDGFGENVWGLSACDGEHGYLVPGHFPDLAADQPGELDFDHLKVSQQDDWRDGTVAPYTAGSAIMFEPAASVAALREYRARAGGAAGLWQDPGKGGYGFADSFRPTADGGVEWVAHDRVAIDAGPLLIAIENARTGMIWKTFGSHAFVRDAENRLGLNRIR